MAFSPIYDGGAGRSLVAILRCTPSVLCHSAAAECVQNAAANTWNPKIGRKLLLSVQQVAHARKLLEQGEHHNGASLNVSLLVVYLSPADNSPRLNWSVLVLCQAQKQPPCYTLLLGVFDGFIRTLEIHASRRLTRIFLRDDQGRRLVYGGTCTLQEDPHWRDYLLFYKYFHGDNGAGLGASHQTGWTSVIARGMQLFATSNAEQFLELGKITAFTGLEVEAQRG